MRNTLSAALAILGILLLVQDLQAGESNRKSRNGKPDFFFDEPTTSLQTSTPSPNVVNQLQTLLQSALPLEKGEDDSEETGEDETPKDNQSLLENVSSLSDVWKLLHNVISLLNPLGGGESSPVIKTDGNNTENEDLPKVNQTVNIPETQSDINIDEPFETPLEYASGNDSYDDEDYEESMNFSSPNPQTFLTSQLPYDNENVTPKPVNQGSTEQYSLNETSTKKPVVKKDKPDFDTLSSPTDDEDAIPGEFIDDYINNPPKKTPLKKCNETSPISKGNETDQNLPNQSPENITVPDGKNGTLNNTETPLSPECNNGTNVPLIQGQNGTDIPAKDSNKTKTQVPEQDTKETDESPIKTNPRQNVESSTEKPNFDGQDKKPNEEDGASTSIPLQKNTVAPIQKFPNPLNQNQKPDSRNYQSTKLPVNIKRITQKPVFQRPQPENNTNPIIFDKPSFLLNPLKIPSNTGYSPTNVINPFNKTEILTPQNQFNPIKSPLKYQPNNTNLFIPQNQTSYLPFLKQFPIKKPFLPQNRASSTPFTNQFPGMKPYRPQNRTSYTPFTNQFPATNPFRPPNQTSYTPFANQFPVMKPFRPQNQTSYSPFSNQFPTIKPFPPQNQTNYTPLASQFPKIKPLLPRNQTSSPSGNQYPSTKPSLPQNQISYTPYTNQFPSPKPLLPQDQIKYTPYTNQFPNTNPFLPQDQIKYTPYTNQFPNTNPFLPRDQISYSPYTNQFPNIQPFLPQNRTSYSPFLNQFPNMNPFLLQNQTGYFPFLNQFPLINAGSNTESVTSTINTQQSTSVTSYSSDEAAQQYDSEDLDDEDYTSSQENASYESDTYDQADNTDDTDEQTDEDTDEHMDENTDNTDDNADNTDDTQDNADDMHDNTNANTDEKLDSQNEDNNPNVFHNFSEMINSARTQWPQYASFFDSKNYTELLTNFHKEEQTPKPEKGYSSILEYIYDHSKNPLFTAIKEHNKTIG